MNRAQLISAVSTETGYSKGHVEEFLSGFEKVVSSCLANDIEVTTGIGKFSVSQRAERQGRNPHTGEALTIAASKAPKFKPSKSLKDAVN